MIRVKLKIKKRPHFKRPEDLIGHYFWNIGKNIKFKIVEFSGNSIYAHFEDDGYEDRFPLENSHAMLNNFNNEYFEWSHKEGD